MSIPLDDDDERNPAHIAYESALRDLEEEHLADSCLTVAAMELLSLTALFNGQGERSSRLLRQSIAMGQKLQLLPDRNSTLATSLPVTDEKSRAMAIVAWGLFCFAS